tara:strand:+ start:744 stop:929 length:186 start_codon:yes stop_codon:yes gene_type:complete
METCWWLDRYMLILAGEIPLLLSLLLSAPLSSLEEALFDDDVESLECDDLSREGPLELNEN